MCSCDSSPSLFIAVRCGGMVRYRCMELMRVWAAQSGEGQQEREGKISLAGWAVWTADSACERAIVSIHFCPCRGKHAEGMWKFSDLGASERLHRAVLFSTDHSSTHRCLLEVDAVVVDSRIVPQCMKCLSTATPPRKNKVQFSPNSPIPTFLESSSRHLLPQARCKPHIPPSHERAAIRCPLVRTYIT